MRDFSALASEDELNMVVRSCKNNGLNAVVAGNSNEAREVVLDMIPKGAEVFTTSSVALEASGISEAINTSGEYDSVREKLNQMDSTTQKKEMKRLGSVPDWIIGGAHAVTQEGHLLIASYTGSQLAAEVYGAEKVIYVMGTQKIVKDDDEAVLRIYEYVLPLEDARLMKLHGAHSSVNKLLIINREVTPERVTVILVKEMLGF